MDQLDPDTEAMLRLQRGDLSGFDVLVRRNQEMVLNLAYRFLGNRAEAEDAVQEVFLRVFRARHRYRPTAKFTTWLYRIATNHCLNTVKARQNQPVRSLYVVDEEGETALRPLEDGSPSPAMRLEQEELAAAVRAAVGKLPPNQRLAVVLNRYHGLGYQEIAAAMGTTVTAVKSLLMRARVNLRERLAPLVQREGTGPDGQESRRGMAS